ncbi:MAG: hypothetical protein LBK07_05745 [Tannerella sp.]|nr:hypothetical protein [Tannerella sp.]
MGNPLLGVASTLRGIANYGMLTAILLWVALVAQAAGNPKIIDFPFDKEYFLLGVIEEYKVVSGQAIISRNDSIACQFSDSLSSLIDYYSYKSYYRNISGEAVYTGRIRKEKINTPEQKLSFLAGLFFRYGCLTYISGYYFSGTGAYKADLCIDFLLDLNCEVRRDVYPFPPFFPGNQIIYFTPSEEVQEMIKHIENPYRKDLMMWEDYQMLHARDFFYGGMRKEKSGDRELANADYMEAIQLCDKYLRNHPNDYQVLRMSAMLTLLTEGMDAGIKAHEKLLEKPLEEDGLQDIRAFIRHFKNKNREAVLKSIIYE